MSEHSPEATPSAVDPHPLTEAVRTAQRGLRADVEALIGALAGGELLAPLAEDIEGAPEGQQVELDRPLALTPHMLVDVEGQAFAAFFTETALALPIADHLGWQTSGDELKLCAFPAMGALDMTLELIDDGSILGLVLNPATDEELQLSRDEIASMLQGRALPLVGYVDRFAEDNEATLVAEPGDPPPPEFVAALDACIGGLEGVKEYRLLRTFNPERDREPHFSITLVTEGELDAPEVNASITDAIADTVPEPGYVDIFFEDAGARPSPANPR